MTNITQLNQQNKKIKELSNVLNYLIKDKEMCNSEVTCDLFLTYVENVTDHLYLEEREVYRHLLNHNDLKVRNLTSDFFSGSIEIKKIFNEYLGRWCKNKKLRIVRHEEFLQDSEEIFHLVEKRINAETDILYPMIMNTLGEELAA